MATTEYRTFQDAYVAILREVRDQPEFINSPRGFRSRELLGVSYRLHDPRERLIRIPQRRTNIVFCFAEALWYLSGKPDLEFISFYAPSIRKYSADGYSLRGTAYGPRIFHCGGAGFDQWRSVQRALTQDPDSKRALIQIYSPEELLVDNNIDVACTIGLQYMIREGRLHAVSFMRANDAYRGAVSDVFSFTFLQELMATELGLAMGSYTHVAGSYHLYEPDGDAADRVLDDTTATFGIDPFPSMPPGDNWPAVRTVLEIEHALRTGALTLDTHRLDRIELPAYWAQIVTLLALYAQNKLTGTPDPDLIHRLDPLYARALHNAHGRSTETDANRTGVR